MRASLTSVSSHSIQLWHIVLLNEWLRHLLLIPHTFYFSKWVVQTPSFSQPSHNCRQLALVRRDTNIPAALSPEVPIFNVPISQQHCANSICSGLYNWLRHTVFYEGITYYTKLANEKCLHGQLPNTLLSIRKNAFFTKHIFIAVLHNGTNSLPSFTYQDFDSTNVMRTFLRACAFTEYAPLLFFFFFFFYFFSQSFESHRRRFFIVTTRSKKKFCRKKIVVVRLGISFHRGA